MTTAINNRISVGNVDIGGEKRLAVIALYDVDEYGNLTPVEINPLSREAEIIRKCRDIVQRTLTDEGASSTILSMDLRGITLAKEGYPQAFTSGAKAVNAMKNLVFLLTTPQLIGQRVAEVSLIDKDRFAEFTAEQLRDLATTIGQKLEQEKRGEVQDYTADEQLFLNIFRSHHQGQLSLQREINLLYAMQIAFEDGLKAD